jgi:threonine synthase
VEKIMQAHYRCSECGQTFSIDPTVMVCPSCAQQQCENEPLRGILDVMLDGETPDVNDILAWLPIEKKFFPMMPVGNTPLWEPAILRKKNSFPNLFIKDDSRNPTGSLKDRASFLVAACAIKHKIASVTLASTGNAASSMAGIGAASGLKITLFLPEKAPEAKIVQALQYGARVIPVRGNYDKAFDLCLEYSRRTKELSRNTAYNPLTIEGKKTVSLEIFSQLKRAPDVVFVPTGDGVILSGVYKGFIDLKERGLIKDVPMIYAVQAQKSAALFQAYSSGHFVPVQSSSVADSICVDMPRNGFHALRNLKRYKGECIVVSDEEILRAQKELSSFAGLFVEPAGAASYAGFLQIKDCLPANSTVVLLATGNGLKDAQSALRLVKKPTTSIESLDDLRSE